MLTPSPADRPPSGCTSSASALAPPGPRQRWILENFSRPVPHPHAGPALPWRLRSLKLLKLQSQTQSLACPQNLAVVLVPSGTWPLAWLARSLPTGITGSSSRDFTRSPAIRISSSVNSAVCFAAPASPSGRGPPAGTEQDRGAPHPGPCLRQNYLDALRTHALSGAPSVPISHVSMLLIVLF